MPENKTKPTNESVGEFLVGVENDQKRSDTQAIVDMMHEVTGYPPKMWGASIIGFGSYSYKYRSGHSGEWSIVGVSPRKRNITVYIMPGFGQMADLLGKLGKHKTAKSCLYINKLADLDVQVLREIIVRSVDYMKEHYEVTS